MSTKAVAVVLLSAGIVLLVLSASADAVGVGGAPGFGWKQMAGVAIGVVMAAVGIARLRSGRA